MGSAISKIMKMADKLFASEWKSLPISGAIEGNDLKYPGVYVIAYEGVDLTGNKIALSNVYYAGMSNSSGGVRQRLKQFRNGIEKGKGHSGGDRFFREIGHGTPFSRIRERKKFFFTAYTIPCVSNKKHSKKSDYIDMGHVACLEQYVFARIFDQTGKKPFLNK